MSRWNHLSETEVRKAVILAERGKATLQEAIAYYKYGEIPEGCA